MKLYHGTRIGVLTKLLKRGLVPRGTRLSNWEHAPSHPNAVYLTHSYAPYFAIQAMRLGDKHALIVEIETDKLDLNGYYLVPDEDACEQTMRGKDGVGGDLHERTAWYRSNLENFCGDGQWKISLAALGNCAYMGAIPPEAITRVAVIPKSYHWWWDAEISLINQRLIGTRYQAQMKRLFGDEVSESEEDSFKAYKVPFSGHQIHMIEDGRLSLPKFVSFPDERPGFDDLRSQFEVASSVTGRLK